MSEEFLRATLVSLVKPKEKILRKSKLSVGSLLSVRL